MWLDAAIVNRLLTDVTRTPEGCSFFLAQAAEAEATGEALVFARLAEHAPDRLKKLIGRHHADERAHAAALAGAARGCSGAWPQFPAGLNMVKVLDRELGCPLLSGPIRTDEAAVRIYIIMELLERRAAHEIGLLAQALSRCGRPEGQLLARISADEARHVRYCRAALRLYGQPRTDSGPEDSLSTSRLGRELHAEVRRAFDLYDRDTLAYLLETGLLGAGLGRVERAAWRTLWVGLAVKTAVRDGW